MTRLRRRTANLIACPTGRANWPSFDVTSGTADGVDDASNAARHGLVLACSASLDHVLARSKGGLNAEGNLVTDCWPCQFARGNDPIERVGLLNPADRHDPPVLRGWDGCDWYK